MTRPHLSVLPVLAAALLAVGCGKSGTGPVPVTGRVLVNGRPAAGAAVVFHPVNAGGEATRPLAQVDQNGEFRLTTASAGDGAAPGEYKVTLTWYVSPPRTGKRAEGDDPPAKNLIPDRYGKPDSTPVTATVKSDGTEPIRIEINVPPARQ